MKNKRALRIGLLLALSAAFLYFFLRSIKNWREVLQYVSNVDWRWAIPALLATPIHFFTRGLRWKYLLHHEKRDVGFGSLWKGNVVGFTVTYIFPGRLGEIAKPLYVARREKMRPGFVLGTCVVERIFDILTMTTLLGLFLLGRPLFGARMPITTEGITRLQSLGGLAVGLAGILLALIMLCYFFKDKALAVGAKAFRVLPHRLRDKAVELLREFIDGLGFFHSLGDFLIYVVLGFLVWLSIIFYYWLYLFAFRFPVPFFWVFPYLFLTAAGATIPTQGMIGGFHILSQFGLTMLLGMNPNLAGGYTIVVHLVQLVLTCILGYIILTKEGLSLKQIRTMGEADKT